MVSIFFTFTMNLLYRFTEDDVDEMYREAPIKVICHVGLKHSLQLCVINFIDHLDPKTSE